MLKIIGGGKGSFSRVSEIPLSTKFVLSRDIAWQVYKARRLSDGMICALKIIKKDLLMQDVDDIVRSSLQHPFFTRLLGAFVDNKHAYFVYDYVSGGMQDSHSRALNNTMS
jgi:hypothetical protein